MRSDLEISRAPMAGGSEFRRNEECGRQSRAEKIQANAGQPSVMRLVAERRERVSEDGSGQGHEQGHARGGGNNGKLPKAKVAGSPIISGRESRNLRGFIGGDEPSWETNSRGGLGVFRRDLSSRRLHVNTGVGRCAGVMERGSQNRRVEFYFWIWTVRIESVRRTNLRTALSDIERTAANGGRLWLFLARAGFSARVHGRPDGVSGRKTGAGEKNPCARAGRVHPK